MSSETQKSPHEEEFPTVSVPIKLRIVRYQSPDPFLWDGSDLGQLHPSCIRGMVQSADLRSTYYSIDIGGHLAICRIKKRVNTFPNIVDELKPVFGLPKLGTHRCTINGSNHLLIRTRLSPSKDEFYEEVPLSRIGNETKHPNGNRVIDAPFVSQVQELFAFREILGVVTNTERTVGVRIVPVQSSDKKRILGYRSYPIGINESQIDPLSSSRVLPETMMKKWFNGTSLDVVVRRILGIQTKENLVVGISTLRSKIERVIQRVDSQSIWVSVFIIERSMRYLNDLSGPSFPETQDHVSGLSRESSVLSFYRETAEMANNPP